MQDEARKLAGAQERQRATRDREGKGGGGGVGGGREGGGGGGLPRWRESD